MIEKFHRLNVYIALFVFSVQVVSIIGEIVCGYQMLASTIVPLLIQWLFFAIYVVWSVYLRIKQGRPQFRVGIIFMLLPSIFVIFLVIFNK